MPRTIYLCQHARCQVFAEAYQPANLNAPESLPKGWTQIQLTLGNGRVLNFTLCPAHKIDVHSTEKPYSIDLEAHKHGVRLMTVEADDE